MTEIFVKKIPNEVLTERYLDAGSIHGNRVAILNEDTLFFADRQKVFRVQLDLDVDVQAQIKPTKNLLIPFPIPLASIQVIEEFSIHSPENAKIQNIGMDRKNEVIAVVDGFGNLYLHNVSNEKKIEERPTKRQKTESTTIMTSYKPSSQPYYSICEHGWTGVTSNGSNYAIGRFFAKDTHVVKRTHDGIALERVFHASNYVTACKFFTITQSNTPLLAIADHSQVSIWDIRATTCVSRLWRTRGCIMDIAVTDHTSNNGKTTTLLGVTGTDRDVTIYEAEKWSPKYKWTKSLKYTPSYLTFSSHEGSNDICYVGGFDNSELKAGNFMNPKINNVQGSFNQGMSGDARWLGLDCLPKSDTIAGVTQNASVFLIRNPYKMVQPTST
jgi:hypothetical protein